MRYFRLLSGVGSAIIRLVFARGDRRSLPPVESAGNDIVRELIGIAQAASAANAPIHPRTLKSICHSCKAVAV